MDLDLSVPRGEIFGFLGPNGAGKTTTIRLLLDLLRPDRGRAEVLGEEVRKGGAAPRARAWVTCRGTSPSFRASPGPRTLDFFSHLQGRPPVRRAEVLAALGFPAAALARQVRTYSTGMRQMIGIAIAFQHDPDLLILDEPTTGLDPLVRGAFLDLLRAARHRGATVFLSSHVLDEVDRVADRVGLIAHAKLRLVEGVDEIRRRWPRQVRVRMKDGSERTFEAPASVPDSARSGARPRSARGRGRPRGPGRRLSFDRGGEPGVNRALLAFILRRHRFALIACWVVPVLIALAVGLIYPTYAKEREAIERLTKFFGQFFGGDVIDLLSPKGFLTLPFQHPLTLLMLAISAAAAPLAMPAGDRGRGALDMLLATRLSRSSLGRTVFARRSRSRPWRSGGRRSWECGWPPPSRVTPTRSRSMRAR